LGLRRHRLRIVKAGLCTLDQLIERFAFQDVNLPGLRIGARGGTRCKFQQMAYQFVRNFPGQKSAYRTARKERLVNRMLRVVQEMSFLKA
jgi:hypothetical protein